MSTESRSVRSRRRSSSAGWRSRRTRRRARAERRGRRYAFSSTDPLARVMIQLELTTCFLILDDPPRSADLKPTSLAPWTTRVSTERRTLPPYPRPQPLRPLLARMPRMTTRSRRRRSEVDPRMEESTPSQLRGPHPEDLQRTPRS